MLSETVRFKFRLRSVFLCSILVAAQLSFVVNTIPEISKTALFIGLFILQPIWFLFVFWLFNYASNRARVCTLGFATGMGLEIALLNYFANVDEEAFIPIQGTLISLEGWYPLTLPLTRILEYINVLKVEDIIPASIILGILMSAMMGIVVSLTIWYSVAGLFPLHPTQSMSDSRCVLGDRKKEV